MRLHYFMTACVVGFKGADSVIRQILKEEKYQR
uniref:Uncharacterized protein n=1 Tax=Lotus japonicus TaxID=34305 RepID=I3T6Z4_LOTJA|nr:unknown [Lotus japonicus]